MKDDAVYLRHIAECIAKIRTYTASGQQAFEGNSLVQDAVVRNLEVIGEAVKRVSEARKANAPEVPWKQIAGMRDVLIHNYFGVKMDRVWQVVERDLGPLNAAVSRLLQGIE
jgi:uncharacterized protein with HEPN domain